jgi:hypothetical protein
MDAENERSLGELFKSLTNDLSTLVRSEIALAKLEIKQSLTRLGMGGAFFLLAALLAVGALILLLVTLILVLAIWIPAWASTLIIAVLMLLMGALFVFLGKKKMENLDFLPEAAIENVRSDIETLKGARKRS